MLLLLISAPFIIAFLNYKFWSRHPDKEDNEGKN